MSDNSHHPRAPREIRAQPPIRWFHPNRHDATMAAAWAAGLLVATVLPALVVSPGQTHASVGEIGTAFGITVAGAAVMVAVVLAFNRRRQDPALLVLGIVPAAACVIGGIILAATKIG